MLGMAPFPALSAWLQPHEVALLALSPGSVQSILELKPGGVDACWENRCLLPVQPFNARASSPQMSS